MHEINETTITAFLSKGYSVITFTSPWCSACKKVIASHETLTGKWEDRISFGICDISVNPVLASKFNVLSLPQVIIFSKGTPIRQMKGPLTDAVLKDVLGET